MRAVFTHFEYQVDSELALTRIFSDVNIYAIFSGNSGYRRVYANASEKRRLPRRAHGSRRRVARSPAMRHGFHVPAWLEVKLYYVGQGVMWTASTF